MLRLTDDVYVDDKCISAITSSDEGVCVYLSGGNVIRIDATDEMRPPYEIANVLVWQAVGKLNTRYNDVRHLLLKEHS